MPDVLPPQIIPQPIKCSQPVPNRWGYDFPIYRRYGPQDEAPIVPGHWYDPFNRNKLKGDYPIIGQQTFLSVSATSDTFVTRRRIPIPSGLGSVDPDSQEFFGKIRPNGGEPDIRVHLRSLPWRYFVSPDRLAHSRDARGQRQLCASRRERHRESGCAQGH